MMYSQAVFIAPSTSPDLGLAYANRSACFQKLGGQEGYNLALRDIKLALDSKYPQDKVFKLYERQGECESSLGKHEQAKESFEMSIEMIKKHAKMSKDKIEKFISGIQKKMSKLSMDQPTSDKDRYSVHNLNTDLGEYTMWIFLPFRFYVKSILVILMPPKTAILTTYLSSSEF